MLSLLFYFMYLVIFQINDLGKEHIYLSVYHFWNFKFIYVDPCYNLIYFYLTNLTVSSHVGVVVINFLAYQTYFLFLLREIFASYQVLGSQLPSAFSTFNTFYNFYFVNLQIQSWQLFSFLDSLYVCPPIPFLQILFRFSF